MRRVKWGKWGGSGWGERGAQLRRKRSSSGLQRPFREGKGASVLHAVQGRGILQAALAVFCCCVVVVVKEREQPM